MKWTLEQDKLAVLAILMLRGPQTAGEIRTRTGRLHEFKSVADVETALQFLIDKYPPIVAKLPLAPGSREPRYGQLLGGEEALARESTAGAYGGSASSAGEGGGSRADRVAQLEQEIASLREEVASLAAQVAELRAVIE